jgi:hypothetical protein
LKASFSAGFANEAAHGAVDELRLSDEFACEPAVAIVEQGDVLLEPGKLSLLGVDAGFERVALGDEALKGAGRIEQKAFDLTLGAVLAGSRPNSSRRFTHHGDNISLCGCLARI